MITVGGGTGINFSSKRAKDSKNGTAGGQFGVAGTVEAAKVKKYPVRVVFGLGRGRPIQKLDHKKLVVENLPTSR